MRRIVLVLLIALALTSCSSYRDVRVTFVQMSSFKLYSTSRAELAFDIVVNNPTHSTISLSDISGILKKENRAFADIQLKEQVSAGPMATTKETIVVEFSLLDPMALLSIGLNISSWDMNNFTLNGSVLLKSDSGLRKKFKFRDVTLERALKILE